MKGAIFPFPVLKEGGKDPYLAIGARRAGNEKWRPTLRKKTNKNWDFLAVSLFLSGNPLPVHSEAFPGDRTGKVGQGF